MAGIAAVVLAAGRSRRFGADKLLHPLALSGVTLPLATHSLRPWLEVFQHVTVVVRPQADALREAVECALHGRAAAIEWVECAMAEQGMGHSLAAGIAATGDAAGWVLGLADMPAVPVDAIATVRAALLQGAPLAAPFRNGRRGHPVGFAARYRDELLAIRGDAGARALLERDYGEITRIETEHDGIFTDIDSTQDLNPFFEILQEKT